MRILIAGAQGQLGREFAASLSSQHEIYAPPESDFNVSDIETVLSVVFNARPEVIINCAAYSLVDKAEDERHHAHLVNAAGPKNLAMASKKAGAVLVHFSTEYVFDGKKDTPYTEDDAVNPLNVYGETKLEGEALAMELSDECLVLRLSWLFGLGRQNFLYKLRTWAKSRNELDIAEDEVSVPTYTESVVDATMEALGKKMRGLYHCVSGGQCSRFELAEHFFAAMKMDMRLNPVGMAFFDRRAKRPHYSAMSNERFERDLGRKMPHWQDEVSRFARHLLGESD